MKKIFLTTFLLNFSLAAMMLLSLTSFPHFADVSSPGTLEVGIAEPFAWGGPYDLNKIQVAKTLLGKEAELGIQWHREWISWDKWQTSENGPLDQNSIDMMNIVVDQEQANGIKTYGVIVNAPWWSNGQSSGASKPGYIPGNGDPRNPEFQKFVDDYASFVGQVVALYSDPQRYIDHWEIWLEPDLQTFWSNPYVDYRYGPEGQIQYLQSNVDNTKYEYPWHKRAVGYAYLLQKVYSEAKEANPDSKIIIGGATAWLSYEFMKVIYHEQAGGFFDIANIHPWTWPSQGPQVAASPKDSPEFAEIGRLRQLMVNNGDSGKKMWITATGWTTQGPNPPTLQVSEEQQAQYMIDALETLTSNYPYVEAISFFRLLDPRFFPSTNPEAGFGLLYSDFYTDMSSTGHARFDPKPAFNALKNYLANSTPAPEPPAPPPAQTPAPANLAITRQGGSFLLSWSPPEGGEGIAGYEVERAGLPIGPWTLVATSTDAGITDPSLDSDTLYYYRVSAYNAQGTRSAYSEPASARSLMLTSVIEEENTPYLKWTGYGWRTSKGGSYSGGATKYTKTKGNALEVPFRGTAVWWTASKAYNRGKADVYLDGVYQATVDLYQSSAAYRQTVFAKSGLTDTDHTLKIVATGAKRPEASGTYIDVDAIGIYGYSPGVNLEQTSTLAYWRGSWTTYSGSFFSGGSTKATASPSSTVDMTFKGTSIAWIGANSYNRGKANIYIDGVFQTTIDQYAPSVSYQQVLYARRGLSNSTHKLRIVATGTKNESATDPYVEVDAFVTGIPAGVP